MEASQCASIENGSFDECVTPKEMHRISLKVLRQQYKRLARELELTDPKIDDIVANSSTNLYGDEEVIYNILRVWRETNGKLATRRVLKNALVVIGRKDLADEIYSDLWQHDPEKIKTHYIGLQVQIEEIQTKVYQEVELPQVNWTDRILPLEELYVNLELMKNVDDYEGFMGVPMKLEELFNQIKGKDPLRILIEGGAGYGKTTLCYKLLNDWGRNRNYIRTKFKMVFLFELRYFEESDSIEEMLKSECKEIDVNGKDGISCIEAFQNVTLLILDGFDEMGDEGKEKVLSLIEKKKYPSMFVVVTSRRGMFGKDKSGKGVKTGGGLKKTLQNMNLKNLWNKRVLIKGVTTDKIETFMLKYFNKDFKNWESKIQHIISGEMVKLFECPLFLILLAMLLEEKTFQNISSKTKLYMEFFNFIIRRNLIREKKISDEEEINIFNISSLEIESKVLLSLDQFGRLAIEHLCENKLMFQEKDVLENCRDKMIFHLGFLMKIPKMEVRRKENFYQPIHKSFLEFIGAHSMWKLFEKDKNQFKQELERIVKKGLKPTDDSLFFVFLGGFMNSKAYVLFQFLTSNAYWFNIESICFTNILLEIKDISSFFPSLEPMLDSYIPPFYSIAGFNGLTEDYFHSEIHSLILKYACDQQLIKVLRWDSAFSWSVSCDLYVDRLFLYLSNEVCKICPRENGASIKCKNIFCHFSEYFEVVKWNDFVSLFDSIESEKINFFFDSKSNEISSIVLELLHKELIEGQWKQRNIDKIIFYLNDFENPQSLSLLEDLVKKNRINEGINVSIYPSEKRTEEKTNILTRETDKLFDAVMKSKTLKDFSVINWDFKFSPRLKFNGTVNPRLRSFSVLGSFSIGLIENFSVEELTVYSLNNDMKLDFIQNLQDTTFLSCGLMFFNLLVDKSWPGLTELQELVIDIHHEEQVHFINSLSQLTNLQVFTLDLRQLQTIPSNSKVLFINLFSSLRLRTCQFIFVNYFQSFQSYSFFLEALMEGLKNKEKDYSRTVSNEGKKVQLQELAISFSDKEVDLNEMKDSKEIQWIQLMLQSKLLEEFCWISTKFKDYNYYNNIKSYNFDNIFPSNEKFRITYELDGINPKRSRLAQVYYRWFIFNDRYCIKFVDE